MRMKMTKRILQAIIVLAIQTVMLNASAGSYLVTNGTLVDIASNYLNTDTFTVVVTGGDTNSCVNQSINFPAADAGNYDLHKRNYATALAAFALGSKVTIWSFYDGSCNRATYI